MSLVGLIVNVHHCAGQVSYQIFGLNISNDCDCEHQSVKHTSSCCHNEQIEIKSVENIQIASNFSLVKNNWTFIIQTHFNFNCEISSPVFLFKKVIKPDYPPRHSPPVYILNRVFLI